LLVPAIKIQRVTVIDVSEYPKIKRSREYEVLIDPSWLRVKEKKEAEEIRNAIEKALIWVL